MFVKLAPEFRGKSEITFISTKREYEGVNDRQ